MRSFFGGILCFTTMAIAAPIEDIGALRIVGNQIVGENGEPAQLMGMSFYHGQHKAGRDFVKRSVVQSLAEDWRSSVIRIPMMYGSERGTGGGKGYDKDPVNSVNMVDSIIKAAIDVGIYVVVDWHEVNVIGHQAEAVAFFTDIAKRWGSYSNVIYEIFNEPTSSSWSQIKSYATAVIRAIRSHDPDNLIVVGTRQWSQQVMEPAKDPLKDEHGNLMSNVAYTLHFYASDKNHQALRARSDSAMALGIALFATEWGNSTASGGGNLNVSYMEEFMKWMLEKKLCWCNWSLSDISESSAALRNGSWNKEGLLDHKVSTDGDWADSDLSQSGLFVRNTIIKNNPEYTPVQQVAVHVSKPFLRSRFSVELTRSGIELMYNASDNWRSAEVVNVKGAVLARTRLVAGTSSATLQNPAGAKGLMILHVKGMHGVSQGIKLNIYR